MPYVQCKLYMLIISTFLSNYCNMLFSGEKLHMSLRE